MNIILSAFEQGLVYLPLVLGMYISYQILKITDLTVDGTFVLGASVFAKTISKGLIIATFYGILAGISVGCIVSYMQRKNKIDGLLIGILATFMLYSVNLQILGRPNISLLDKPSILTLLNIDNWLIPLSVIAILLIVILITLLKTTLGLNLRAFAQNQKLLAILGKHVEIYRALGLAISNGLAALSGILAAQINGFSDINMGFGIALISIGAIIIGRHILINGVNNFNPYKEILSCLIGILLYFICLNTLLRIGIDPINLNLS